MSTLDEINPPELPQPSEEELRALGQRMADADAERIAREEREKLLEEEAKTSEGS
jgi:hypothetical protein